ncbi:MAG: hypothetical protein LBE12_04120 [Planctomycetaceae bacterium]|jgi:hypothetical protein|nr:hypothetical protein [Planctomycetaceae bacterium]
MYFYCLRFVLVLAMCFIPVASLCAQQNNDRPYGTTENDRSLPSLPPPLPRQTLHFVPPVVKEFKSVSKQSSVMLNNDTFIFIDPKKPTVKTPVTLNKEEFMVTIGPSSDGGMLMLAIHEFNRTFYSVQIKDNDSKRGVWLSELPEGFHRKFYLFSYRTNENYLAWITNNVIRFKEITNNEDIRKLLETTIQLSNDPGVYMIPIKNMTDGIFHIAHIDDDTNNMELLGIDKKNKNDFEVRAKSKLTGAEFSFVTNISKSRERIKTYNDNRGTMPLLKDIIPSIVLWELSPDMIKAVRDFEEKGYRHWIEEADNKTIVAKLIETKDDEIVVETFQGKQVTLKINTLIQRDQDYIKEKELKKKIKNIW